MFGSLQLFSEFRTCRNIPSIRRKSGFPLIGMCSCFSFFLFDFFWFMRIFFSLCFLRICVTCVLGRCCYTDTQSFRAYFISGFPIEPGKVETEFICLAMMLSSSSFHLNDPVIHCQGAVAADRHRLTAKGFREFATWQQDGALDVPLKVAGRDGWALTVRTNSKRGLRKGWP